MTLYSTVEMILSFSKMHFIQCQTIWMQLLNADFTHKGRDLKALKTYFLPQLMIFYTDIDRTAVVRDKDNNQTCRFYQYQS